MRHYSLITRRIGSSFYARKIQLYARQQNFQRYHASFNSWTFSNAFLLKSNRSGTDCASKKRNINITRCMFSQNDAADGVIQYQLSDIGEGIAEVVIKEWFVKVGDEISQFDPICEVQSDKATVTISSRYDGTVSKLYYEVDDLAKVGSPLVDIDTSSMQQSKSTNKPVDVMPVEEDDQNSNKGINIHNSTTLTEAQEVIQRQQQRQAKNSKKSSALATPAVRKLCKEHGLNVLDIEGTGKDGRVLKEDVLMHIENSSFTRASLAQKAAATSIPSPLPSPPTPSSSPSATVSPQLKSIVQPSMAQILPSPQADQIVPLSGIAKTMVKTMADSVSIPHFTYCDEIDMDGIIETRKQVNAQLARNDSNGAKISMLPFFIKAASIALLQFPKLNAHVDNPTNVQNLIVKSDHNIAIAIDTPHGLVVPNIKSCQQKSILEISNEIARLQTQAQKNQLNMDDLKHHTFTLSNIGSIGGTYAKPVLLSPTIVIGAIGKTQLLPRYTKSQVQYFTNQAEEYDDEMMTPQPTHVMQVSWSADHRVVDGATMARFSNVWKHLLENPNVMMMYLR